ncbi:hypothetical protein MRX96_012862 [Rhipicephalus microplus]
MLNVTVRKTYYRRRIDITQQMFEGNVDVFGSIIAVNSESYRNFAIPPIITAWYESFYAKRLPPLPLSFYVVLKESKVALLLVAVTLLLTLFVLVAADMDRIREWSFDSLAVSFSFLLAAFYATSSTVPRIGRFASMCGFVCGLWLMGIQPFSNYFRGQLTSRVTLRTIPEQLDNIEKLERALDEGRVSPCVVGKTYLHERLLDSFGADSVHRKLHLAFVRNNDAMGLTILFPQPGQRKAIPLQNSSSVQATMLKIPIRIRIRQEIYQARQPNPEMSQLKRENANLCDLLTKLMQEVKTLKQTQTPTPTSTAQDIPTHSQKASLTPATERRVLQDGATGQVRSEVKDMLIALQTTMSTFQQVLDTI